MTNHYGMFLEIKIKDDEVVVCPPTARRGFVEHVLDIAGIRNRRIVYSDRISNRIDCDSVELERRGNMILESFTKNGKLVYLIAVMVPDFEEIYSTPFSGVMRLEYLKFAKIEEGKYYAVIFDINDLKTLNTKHGHVEANRRIQKLVHLVKSVDERILVFRIYGDEFVAIVKDMKTAKKISSILHNPSKDIPSSESSVIEVNIGGNPYEDIIAVLENPLKDIIDKKQLKRNTT